MFKNIKNIEKLVFGRGSFNQLGDILSPLRSKNNKYCVFIVDDYFKGKELADRLPLENGDKVYFINVDEYEPKTEQVDELCKNILDYNGLPAVVIGIGGGSIMDIAKASSLILTNPGSATQYQGLNLINKAGVYKIGIPTVSGTGAECSTTAVLTGPVKKLGIKCDYTVFNQVVLDADLIATVPKNQWFYTGMDTFIHDFESKSGIFYNTFSAAYGDQSIELCYDVFLRDGCGQTAENNEKLMVASLFGGLSLTYSEVGVCHALSYGLSFVFGTRHGIANCIAFNHLEEYYGQAVLDFKKMVEIHQIDLPQNLAADWSEKEIRRMAEIAYNLPHMWHHALGPDWVNKISVEQIMDLYRRL
jgi:3-deoxy-alpha-D-manno-octulosonate 8-oxidase